MVGGMPIYYYSTDNEKLWSSYGIYRSCYHNIPFYFEISKEILSVIMKISEVDSQLGFDLMENEFIKYLNDNKQNE